LIHDVSGCHLEYFDKHHTAVGPIHVKFGVPMQNEMPMTSGRLKSKLEIEFQYGSCSFSQWLRNFHFFLYD